MYCFGEYPGYYQEYLTKCGIYPETQPEDQAILKAAKPDFIALNYYRTLVASYLPTDEQHPLYFSTNAKGKSK